MNGLMLLPMPLLGTESQLMYWTNMIMEPIAMELPSFIQKSNKADRETDKLVIGQTNKQMYSSTNRQKDRWTYGQKDGQIDGHMSKLKDRQMDSRTDRRTKGLTDGH
jgi:hypothetical protein